MPFEYLDDIAHSDIAFEANGATPEETFQAAVDATTNVMVEPLSEISSKIERSVSGHSPALDLLLLDLLEQIVYYKDADNLLLRLKTVRIEQREGLYHMDAVLTGEEIDRTRHKLKTDIKAVTLQRLNISQTDNGRWKATVILDV